MRERDHGFLCLTDVQTIERGAQKVQGKDSGT
jgi:hypothetical protein